MMTHTTYHSPYHYIIITMTVTTVIDDSRKLNHCSGAFKLIDFVSYDSQNISSCVLITDLIHKFCLSVKAPQQ
jgi:hypothetical protein